MWLVQYPFKSRIVCALRTSLKALQPRFPTKWEFGSNGIWSSASISYSMSFFNERRNKCTCFFLWTWMLHVISVTKK
jgi:hypothetical protein